MKKFLTILAHFFALSGYAQQRDNRIVIGRSDTVYSNILNEKRTVLVHVPNGDAVSRYPVLYILDGEDHFESAVAIADQLSGVLPDMIIVGITNTVRQRDLTPVKVGQNGNGQANYGGVEKFTGFIEKELIPYIDAHYPAAPYRVFSGHSLGGLAVVNAFAYHTNLFNAYIAIDPSLWWDDQNYVKKIERELPERDFSDKSLFVAIANNIPNGMDTISVLRDNSSMTLIPRAVIPFVQTLKETKPHGLRWTSKFYPNERHGTVELSAEYDALRYLFNYYQFRPSQFTGRPEMDVDSAITAHYNMVSEKLGYKVGPTENMINELAYGCMGEHNMKEAYKLFRRNIKEHPGSSNAFDSLGDYYVEAGDKSNAIKAFTRSLQLLETTDTRRKLNELTQTK